MPTPVPVLYRYRVSVLRVVDADTLEVDVDLGFYTWVRMVKLRLKGIDCPEMSTPEGVAAKEYTTKLLGLSPLNLLPGPPGTAASLSPPLHALTPTLLNLISPVIIADTVKPDKYGNRWDARVYLPDGRCLNDVLVEAGFAKKMKG